MTGPRERPGRDGAAGDGRATPAGPRLPGAPAPGRDGSAAPDRPDRLALQVEGLDVRYGGVQALHGVDLEVREGELVTVIGANGAGKSSLLGAIVGIVPKHAGRVTFEGRDISAHSPEDLVGRGVTLVPERRELFAALSVRDNLQLGAFHRYRKRDREVEGDLERVFETFPRLAERQRQLAGTMSGGEQQMLAMGRAMMASPRLLLLDEPSLGLAPLIVEEIFNVVAKLRDSGATVLLIEQNARAALRLADHAYLLEAGNVRLGASAKDMADDERVATAYLGHRTAGSAGEGGQGAGSTESGGAN